jgi:hypothetical protein
MPVDLLLTRHKITAATLGTFEESLIDIAIACLMASRAKVPRGDLHRLPSLLMKDHGHIVVRPPHLCYGHGLSPLYWDVTPVQSCQFLAEAIRPLLEALDRNPAERRFPTHLYAYGILSRVVRRIARPHAEDLANAPIPTADKRIHQRLHFPEGHHTSSAAARIR